MSNNVRAIQVSQIGGPEVLELCNIELGEPGELRAGQLRVRVAAAGVNYIDTYFRTGLYPRPLPFICGLEGAGEVEAVGPDVAEFAVGDLVAWSSAPGSYADAVIVPAASVVKVPAGVAAEVAAASMLQGMTAHYLAHGVRATQPGDTALVHAAAGGTGLVLVQTLKAAGATVIGTCGSAEKAELAAKNGCDEVIRYDEVEFAPVVRELTGSRGVDVVYDGVGQSTFEGSLASLRPRGLLCLFGQASGPVPPFDLGRLNNMGSLFVTRPSLLHYTSEHSEFVERATAVLNGVASGALEIRIGARFGLADAAEAHRALEGRTTTGKLVLLP